jgi:hypothetical protein
MAMYNLPADEKWPQQLGRVIQSYMQGQEIKRQRQLQQAQMLMLAQKQQQAQQKNEADIAMKRVYMQLLERMGGGGQPQADDSVMPGLEGGARVSGWGPSGPRVEFPKQKTQMDIIRDIAAIAAQTAKLPEGSPQKQLAESTMKRLREQLADMQGQEIRETPEVPPKSLLGIDIPYTGTPAKTEVVPKGTVRLAPRKKVQSKTVQPKKIGHLEGAGVGSIGSELKKAYFPQGTFIDKPYKRTHPPAPKKPVRFTGKPTATGKTIKAPPPPKDPKERESWDRVMYVYFKLPTSVQYTVWQGYQGGLTWKQIAESDDLAKYLK